MFIQMSLPAFKRLFYIFQFFWEFILIYAVDKLFFLHCGLEIYQIAILITCWSMLVILLQVPTGALADRWSRKKMLVLSGLFISFGYIIWFFSSTFWTFLSGFVFISLGGTFVSGTLEAYVVDFLRQKDKEEEFEKLWGRGYALRHIGIAVALALGGVASAYSYELVVVLSALSPLITVGVALLLPQVKPVTSAEVKGYFSFLKGGIKRAFSNLVLVRVFLYSGIVYAALGVLEEYDQVLLSSWLGLSNSFIGIWLAIGVGVSSISAFFAYKFTHTGWKVLYAVAMVTGVLLIIMAFSQSLFLLGILILLYAFSALMSVLIQGMIQREIRSDERATITSICSLVMEAGAIVLGLSFGFVANQFGIQIGYGFYGLVILVYLLGHFMVRRIGLILKHRGFSEM
jgi:MFS family permease